MTLERRLGEYELEVELGRGAMGTVYRARSADGELVALKVLDPALGADDAYRARFAREARVAHEVRDRHLVRILEVGDADGRPYLVLEYVSGGALSDRLRRGALALDESLRLVGQVAAGLDALHRHGLVHRDVKPSNIMLREDGSAALTDFGVAKGAAYTVLTRPGQVLGTLDYLAPELVRGGEATPASDIYALGCVAFECLAGAPPVRRPEPVRRRDRSPRGGTAAAAGADRGLDGAAPGAREGSGRPTADRHDVRPPPPRSPTSVTRTDSARCRTALL